MKVVLTLMAVFSIINCNGQNNLEKAIVTPSQIDTLIFLEKQFSENDSTPPPQNEKWYRFLPGKNNKVLVTAAHATSQMREGAIKRPDGGTGSLALSLNKYRNIPVLVTSYMSPSDPNYYDDNEFKDSLSKIIDELKPILIIDLHGSHPFRPYDVDFGTMKGRSMSERKYLLDSLTLELRQNGLTNLSLDYFSASTNQTITKFVWNKGYSCIQLEINSNYLSADEGNIYAQKTAQLLQALIRFIDDIHPNPRLK